MIFSGRSCFELLWAYRNRAGAVLNYYGYTGTGPGRTAMLRARQNPKLSGICDLDLAGPHGLKGGLMLGGRNAGAAGRVAGDGRLRQGGLEVERV